MSKVPLSLLVPFHPTKFTVSVELRNAKLWLLAIKAIRRAVAAGDEASRMKKSGRDTDYNGRIGHTYSLQDRNRTQFRVGFSLARLREPVFPPSAREGRG